MAKEEKELLLSSLMPLFPFSVVAGLSLQGTYLVLVSTVDQLFSAWNNLDGIYYH